MAEYRRTWKRILFLTTFAFAAAALALSILMWTQSRKTTPSLTVTPNPMATPTPSPLPILSPLPSPSLSSTPSPTASVAALPQEEPSPTSPSAPSSQISFKLIVPVAGIKPGQLRDTYSEARSEGRVHNALDIMAPRSAQVLAVTTGKILKLFNSVRGGITIYQLSSDQKTILYYAHLERYADNLAEGHVANQGKVIGYVGDTGNAGAGNYHLHFAMWGVTDPKRYWDGVNINPYPLLRESHSR